MLAFLTTLSFPRLRAEALRRAGAKAGLPVAVATPTGIQALSGVSGCQPPFTRGQALRGNDEWVEGVVALTTGLLVGSQNERG